MNTAKLIKEIKENCEGCPLWSCSDCLMPTPEFGCVRDTSWELSRVRKLLAGAYIELSGKKIHASDCATSDAPAKTPKRCDCSFVDGNNLKESDMRWPRGKYNGKRIVGFSVKVRFIITSFYIKPQYSWNFGEPYICWLGFFINTGGEYK